MMSPEMRAILTAESHPTHTKLREFITRRLTAADRRWSQRHSAWREAEQLDRAFRTPDQDDVKTRKKSLTEGVQKIVVPYSYAVLRSMLAFFMQVFTQRVPLIPVAPLSPIDAKAALLNELVLEYQCHQMQPDFVLILMQFLFDSLRYGVGVVKNTYTLREWPDLIRIAEPEMDPFTGQPTGRIMYGTQRRQVVSYEGNETQNVTPFDFLPDPNVALGEFQRGEFCGNRFRRSMTQLRQQEAAGLYVNVDRVRKQGGRAGMQGGWGEAMGEGSDLARITGMSEQNDSGGVDEDGTPFVECHELYAYCDPGNLGLPDDNLDMFGPRDATPELWVLTIANRDTILRAEPANLPGRRFPYEVLEINYDLHAPANVGMIEVFAGLQYHMSWLVNSRMQSVRRTINNQYVVDPSMVEEDDLLGDDPGLLVRLKRQHWQSGATREAVFPLPVQDVTQGHIAVDVPFVRELIDTVTGANNLIMGVANSGRRSATEVQGQLQLSSGRMKMLMEIAARQGLTPLAQQMVRNNQVFLDGMTLRMREPYAKMFGTPMMQITPDLLQGEFLYPFAENGIPTDKLMEANMWKEFLQNSMAAGVVPPAMQTPQFMNTALARYLWAMNQRDLGAFGLGLHNLSMEVAPDEVVAQQVQAGNLVPPEQAAGGQGNGMSADGYPQPPAAGVPNVGNNGMNA